MRFAYAFSFVVIATAAVLAQQSFTYEQVAVSSSAMSLAARTWDPPGMTVQHCDVRVESKSVRYRLDGATATATSGMPLAPADLPLRISVGDASRLSMFGYASASTSALVNVTCGR